MRMRVLLMPHTYFVSHSGGSVFNAPLRNHNKHARALCACLRVCVCVLRATVRASARARTRTLDRSFDPLGVCTSVYVLFSLN